MNQTIKKLSGEAYKQVITSTPSFLVTKEMLEQAFGELVIKDCVQTLINNGYTDAADCLHDVYFGMDDAV